jgi:hypothetical protein
MSEIIRVPRKMALLEADSWLGTKYVDHAGLKGAGCDCAHLLARVYESIGAIEPVKIPPYSPQQWLKKNYEDKTFLNIVLSYANEITEAEVLPADMVLYRVARSWTHGGIIIEWPRKVIHTLKHLGVCWTHGTNEGFVVRRPRRYFRLKVWC